jgi:hypothetical protein
LEPSRAPAPSLFNQKAAVYWLSIRINERFHLWEIKDSEVKTWRKPLGYMTSLLLSNPNNLSFQNPKN